jgi:hypothetical protein
MCAADFPCGHIKYRCIGYYKYQRVKTFPVPVVPALVRDAGDLRSMAQVQRLVDGQRVEIRAQQQGQAGAAPL